MPGMSIHGAASPSQAKWHQKCLGDLADSDYPGCTARLRYAVNHKLPVFEGMCLGFRFLTLVTLWSGVVLDTTQKFDSRDNSVLQVNHDCSNSLDHKLPVRPT